MSTSTRLIVFTLAMTPFAALAADPPKLSCLKDIVFSQEFLQRYPNAGAVCREVVMKEGTKWARFDANVVSVKGNQVKADFLNSYDQAVSAVTFAMSPDARVTMNGKEIKGTELKPGDSLSFWVPESRAGFYAAPGAAESKKLAVVSSPSESR
jgi:hypothetical protein